MTGKLRSRSHRITEDKYEQARVLARNVATNQLPVELKPFVTLDEITFKAFVEAQSWAGMPERRTNWDWAAERQHYSFKHPKRFELAVWHRFKLCSLTLGRTTRSGQRLRLDVIEAVPIDSPLKGRIVPLIYLAAETYAKVIGAHQVRIMNPVNETVRNHYLSAIDGLAYNNEEDFCFKDLRV